MKNTPLSLLCVSVTMLGLCANSFAAGKTEIPHINNRGDDSRKFAERVGAVAVEAARASPQRVRLLNFESSTPADGLAVWNIKMEYYGSLTGSRFVADIIVKINTSKKNAWEVSEISYADDNKVSWMSPNKKKVQGLVASMNVSEPKPSILIAVTQPSSTPMTPASSTPMVTASKPMAQAPVAQNRQQTSTTSTIVVSVPSDAKLYLEGTLSTVTGTSRTFVTPPLEAGKAYEYNMKIEYYDLNGKLRVETKLVEFRGGESANVTFAAATPSSPPQSAPKAPEGKTVSTPVKDDEEEGIKGAKEFLEKDSRMEGILLFAHPSGKYKSYASVSKPKKDFKGNFGLSYKVAWTGLSNNNETTTLDFSFDDQGKLVDLKARSTGFIDPFTAANAVMDLVKDKIIEEVDKNGTETERIIVQALIRDRNAKGLLVWILKYDQSEFLRSRVR